MVQQDTQMVYVGPDRILGVPTTLKKVPESISPVAEGIELDLADWRI
jgi:hypothetical protein